MLAVIIQNETNANTLQIPVFLTKVDGTPQDSAVGLTTTWTKPGASPVVAALTHVAGGAWYVQLSTSDVDTVGNNWLDITGSSLLAGGFHDYVRVELPQQTALADGSIKSTTFAASAITASALADNALTNAKIANGAISNVKFAASAIDNTAIANGAISNAKVAADTIDAAQIKNGALINAKFAVGAIAGTNIAAGAIGNSQIADGALSTAKFADGALTSAKFADGFFTAAKFAAGAITSTVVAANAIGATQIANASITAAKLAGDVIGATGAIATSVLAAVVDGSATIKGVLARLDALMRGKATGLLSSIATFFRRDGVTKAIEFTQDTAAGTRQDASTVSGD